MQSPVQSARHLVAQCSRLLGLKLSRLKPNQLRGHEPLLDAQYLLGRTSALTIFDIGANDGETSESLLTAFPAAQVIAVEPFSDCCKELEQRFAGNPRIRIENVAMGEKLGEAQLNLYSGNRMNSLLELDEDPSNIMAGFTKTGATAVRVDTIDNYCQMHRIPKIDLLKIDTQGYDLNVLRGATTMLADRNIGAILLEVNFVPMYSHQPSFVELHGFLVYQGFRIVDFYNQVWKNGHMAWCDVCYAGPATVGRLSSTS